MKKKSGWGRIGKLIDKLSGTKVLYEGTSEYTTLKVQKKRGTINLISGKNYLQSSYRPGNPPSPALRIKLWAATRSLRRRVVKLRWVRKLRRITRPNAFIPSIGRAFCEGRVKKPVGTVWDYFLIAPLFAPDPNEVKDICILGLGAGVAVKLLNQFYKIERIVGVEIDKVVVDLGRKFFDLNDDNLEIYIQDAAEYVKRTSEKFDLVIIDTFKDDAIDPRCSCQEFYSDVVRHLKPGGVVLINRVDIKKPPPLFAQCYTLTVRNNVFYLGLQKPLPKQVIMERLESFTKGFNGRSKVLKTTNEVYRLR